MGKNLKGKDLGRGIDQKKDGRYRARFKDAQGKTHERYFHSVPEARNWLEKAKYECKYGDTAQDEPFVATELTVDEWYNFWIKNIKKGLAPNTIRNYEERYKFNVKPIIGSRLLKDVKKMDCQRIFNEMTDIYAGSTIRQAYIMVGSMFRAAVENELIPKHPMNGTFPLKPVRNVDDIHFLTVDEQKRFMEQAKRSHNYNQYALILETGLRTGELIGLTWDAIDFDKKTLTVNKTLEFRHKQKFWRAGPPKTSSSYRTIPLTDRAIEILKGQKEKSKSRKEAPELNSTLEYFDRRSGKVMTLCMNDLVFVNFRTGMPNKNSSYDTHLYKLCDEAGIDHFCMHALRHTYATRAIEYGMQPKVLQKLLGHKSLKTTMDRYVHVTEDSMDDAIRNFEKGQITTLGGSKVGQTAV